MNARTNAFAAKATKAAQLVKESGEMMAAAAATAQKFEYAAENRKRQARLDLAAIKGAAEKVEEHDVDDFGFDDAQESESNIPRATPR